MGDLSSSMCTHIGDGGNKHFNMSRTVRSHKCVCAKCVSSASEAPLQHQRVLSASSPHYEMGDFSPASTRRLGATRWRNCMFIRVWCLFAFSLRCQCGFHKHSMAKRREYCHLVSRLFLFQSRELSKQHADTKQSACLPIRMRQKKAFLLGADKHVD